MRSMPQGDGYCNLVLRSARIKKRYAIEDLAKKVGISASTLYSYEMLRLYPRAPVAQKISDILEVCVDKLFPETLRHTGDSYYNFALQTARVNAGYTQCALAKKVRITPPMIDAYEKLRVYPTMAVANKIADTLGVDVNSIFPETLRQLTSEVKKERRHNTCQTLMEKPLGANLVKKLEIESKVRFLYRVNHEMIHKFYVEADIFVMCMKYGGVSIPILEAMASGLPVIYTRGVYENQKELVHGIGLDVDDRPKSIERALTLLINNPTLRKQIGQAERNIMLDISGEKMERKEAKIYLNLISKK